MKRKNFPNEYMTTDGADGGIHAERAQSEYQSRQCERVLGEQRLRVYALRFLKNGGK